jgi:hypothetical protein
MGWSDIVGIMACWWWKDSVEFSAMFVGGVTGEVRVELA